MVPRIFILLLLLLAPAAALFGDARVVYPDSTQASPNHLRTRVYYGTNNTWSPESSVGQPTGTVVRFVTAKASPTRDEYLVGVWELNATATMMRIMRWNGTVWSTDWAFGTASTTLGQYTRPFDIAYERSTGDAIVVYSKNVATTNELAYRIWNGTGWSSETPYDVGGTTALACGIELKPNPSNERIAMVYTVSAITNSVAAAVWNGNGWESNTLLETGALEPGTACRSKAYDITWEEASNELVAAWGRNGILQWAYSTCTGGPPCTWSATALAGTEDGTVLDLGTRPGTDYVGLADIGNAGNDFGGGLWNGAAWNSTGTPDATSGDPDITLGQRSVGVGWLTSGANVRGVLIYADAAAIGVDYTLINGAVSLTPTQCSTTPPAVLDKEIRVVQDPSNSSQFMVLIENANADLWSNRFSYNGAVTCADNNGGAALNVNLPSSTSQSFDFDYQLYSPPIFLNTFINSTSAPASGSLLLKHNLTDNTGVSTARFELNATKIGAYSGTVPLTNYSTTLLEGTLANGNWSYTKICNDGYSANWTWWRSYANDTSNAWNSTLVNTNFQCDIDAPLTSNPGTNVSTANQNDWARFCFYANDQEGNLNTTWTEITGAETINVSATADQSLIAYWQFEANTTSPFDYSGSGWNLTTRNSTWSFFGKPYGSYLIDRPTSVYLDSQHSFDEVESSDIVSLSCWIYPTNVNATNQRPCMQLNAFGIGSGAGGFSGFIWNGSQQNIGGGALNNNTWYHLAITYDNSTLRVYKNGVEVANKTVTGGIQSSSSNFLIGDPSTSFGFYGYVDEVKIWNRTLSAVEVMDEYSASGKRYCTDKQLTAIGNYTFRGWSNDTVAQLNFTSTVSITINPSPVFGTSFLNSTLAGASKSILLKHNLTDNTGVSTARFELNATKIGAYSGSVPLTNFSTTLLEGAASNGNWSYTKICNDGYSANWTWWRSYANDTSNAWNSTIVNRNFQCDIDAPLTSNPGTNVSTANQNDWARFCFYANDTEGNLNTTWTEITNAETLNVSAVTNGTANWYCTDKQLTAIGNYTFRGWSNDTVAQPNSTSTVSVTVTYNSQISLGKSSYSNCGTVYYKVYLYNSTSWTNEDTDISFIDPSNSTVATLQLASTDFTNGVYSGNYSLPPSGRRGEWTLRAVSGVTQELPFFVGEGTDLWYISLSFSPSKTLYNSSESFTANFTIYDLHGLGVPGLTANLTLYNDTNVIVSPSITDLGGGSYSYSFSTSGLTAGSHYFEVVATRGINVTARQGFEVGT